MVTPPTKAGVSALLDELGLAGPASANGGLGGGGAGADGAACPPPTGVAVGVPGAAGGRPVQEDPGFPLVPDAGDGSTARPGPGGPTQGAGGPGRAGGASPGAAAADHPDGTAAAAKAAARAERIRDKNRR